MVDLQRQLFCLILVALLSGQMGMQTEARNLFVFGDSYVDTGNSNKSDWKEPYGITFPGKPTGRASDGRVFTDYIAKYLGLKPNMPVPYKSWKQKPDQDVKDGMNFAFGGTGVFNTIYSTNPNMTIQIDFLEQLIKENVYNASDLSNSVALVSVAGNDYLSYLLTNGSTGGLRSFIQSVVNQTTTNLIRIQRLGVKKIVVDGLQPVGCVPLFTKSSSFKECNSTVNNLAVFHNILLNQAVTELNKESSGNSTFLILDLYNTFQSVLDHPKTYNIQGDPLQACCVGIGKGNNCGSVDENGNPKYTVCDKPIKSFFWDAIHPTQQGWRAVYLKLRTMKALEPLLN